MANDVAIQNQTQGATGTTQEITEVKAYPFFDVEKRKFRYNFKTEYAQDESEKNIKESAIKRDGIDLELPVPSVQTLIEKLTLRDKEAELIVEGIHQVIFNQGRILINKILEEDKVEYNPEAPEGVKKATYSINLTPEMIDLNKLSLSYIANLPPAERRGGAGSGRARALAGCGGGRRGLQAANPASANQRPASRRSHDRQGVLGERATGC